MKIIVDEYTPYMEKVDSRFKYYVLFYGVNNRLNKIEITKKMFLQIFGIHKIKIINGKRRYFIKYQYDQLLCHIELSRADYYEFRSFKSQLIRDKNISDRYIEQSGQTDTRLYKKGIYNSINIETIVYKKYIKDEINKAVSELKEIQARRLIMYYIEEKTYEEIAQIEGCTKRAVKFSVDAAKKNLQNKLKNLFLDYTNK